MASFLFFFFSCSSSRQASKFQTPRLEFLSEYVIPFAFEFQNTKVGGLSGIDYDPAKDLYYLISDDRSGRFPARYYTVKIIIEKATIDTVIFLQTTFLQTSPGHLYPGFAIEPNEAPDPESIRYNPVNNTFAWTNEGERVVQPGKVILQDPSINIMDDKGTKIDSLPIPGQFHVCAAEQGPRRNGTFEGLTFANDHRIIYTSLEEPLYNDGPRAGIHDSSAIIRIIKYDAVSKKMLGQYGYRIDPVKYAPLKAGAYILNGVSEILAFDDNKLLVIERGYTTGRLGCHVRIYLADLSGADNISGIESLALSPSHKLLKKELVLDLEDTGRYIDNIEGITFGPTLPDGHKTLLLIADDNFIPLQKSQLLLFKIE
jgi:hypothetical protein